MDNVRNATDRYKKVSRVVDPQLLSFTYFIHICPLSLKDKVNIFSVAVCTGEAVYKHQCPMGLHTTLTSNSSKCLHPFIYIYIYSQNDTQNVKNMLYCIVHTEHTHTVACV